MPDLRRMLLYRMLGVLGLGALLWLLPSSGPPIGGPESSLPSVKGAVAVLALVIVLGRTLYDTLFTRH